MTTCFKKMFVLSMLAASMLLTGCSFAPIVAQKMGLGTANETDIIAATSKVFSVPTSAVKVADIQQDNTLNGSQIYFAATVQGKSYRCGMLSSFAGSSLPKCVKPGEPLSLQ